MLKLMKVLALVLFVAALALPVWMPSSVGRSGEEPKLSPQTWMPRHRTTCSMVSARLALRLTRCVAEPEPPTARGNGRFEDNKFIFSERETVDDGLGPTYNDVGCSRMSPIN